MAVKRTKLQEKLADRLHRHNLVQTFKRQAAEISQDEELLQDSITEVKHQERQRRLESIKRQEEIDHCLALGNKPSTTTLPKLPKRRQSLCLCGDEGLQNDDQIVSLQFELSKREVRLRNQPQVLRKIAVRVKHKKIQSEIKQRLLIGYGSIQRRSVPIDEFVGDSK